MTKEKKSNKPIPIKQPIVAKTIEKEPKEYILSLEKNELPIFEKILNIAQSGFPEPEVNMLAIKLKTQMKKVI